MASESRVLNRFNIYFFESGILLKEYQKMNRLAGKELVTRSSGGSCGGGARLIAEGKNAVNRFRIYRPVLENGFRIKNSDRRWDIFF
jgi:molybdate transport repressor ModE-like protein